MFPSQSPPTVQMETPTTTRDRDNQPRKAKTKKFGWDMWAIGRPNFFLRCFVLFCLCCITSVNGDLVAWVDGRSLTYLGRFSLLNRTPGQIPTTGAFGGGGHHADIHRVPVLQIMAVLVLCRLCPHWRNHLSIGAMDAPAIDCLDCNPL